MGIWASSLAAVCFSPYEARHAHRKSWRSAALLTLWSINNMLVAAAAACTHGGFWSSCPSNWYFGLCRPFASFRHLRVGGCVCCLGLMSWCGSCERCVCPTEWCMMRLGFSAFAPFLFSVERDSTWWKPWFYARSWLPALQVFFFLGWLLVSAQSGVSLRAWTSVCFDVRHPPARCQLVVCSADLGCRLCSCLPGKVRQATWPFFWAFQYQRVGVFCSLVLLSQSVSVVPGVGECGVSFLYLPLAGSLSRSGCDKFDVQWWLLPDCSHLSGIDSPFSPPPPAILFSWAARSSLSPFLSCLGSCLLSFLFPVLSLFLHSTVSIVPLGRPFYQQCTRLGFPVWSETCRF